MFKTGTCGRWKGPFNNLDVDDFKKCFEEYMSIEDMAKRFGVSKVSINNWRKAFRLSRVRNRPDLSEINKRTKSYNGKENPAYGYRKFDWLNKSILKRLYKMYGSYKRVAIAIGANPTTIKKLCVEKGMCVERRHIIGNFVAKGYNKTPYGFVWPGGLRRLIRERDGFKCMLCGCDETRREHDVHHVLYDVSISDEKLLISLCRSCHCKTNADRNSWITMFKKRLSEEYGYSYDMIERGECVLVGVAVS